MNHGIIALLTFAAILAVVLWVRETTSGKEAVGSIRVATGYLFLAATLAACAAVVAMVVGKLA